MIPVNLDKVNPKFRLLTDLLLFSDRKDLDLSEFNNLLKSNYNIHYSYFWDRFIKSSEVSWDKDFWNHRINFIFSLKNKALSKSLERHLEKRMFNLVKFKNNLNFINQIEYFQFLEYCKIKKNYKQSFSKIRRNFASLVSNTKYFRLVKIINYFIPFVFSSFDDYINCLCKEAKLYSEHVRFITLANKNKLVDNKSFIVNLFFDLLKSGTKILRSSARRGVCHIIEDKETRDLIKQKYDINCKDSLLKMVSQFPYSQLDEKYFTNFKNILYLDPTLADDLLNFYATQLFLSLNHKKANIDRLSKLIKFVPEVTPKKVLIWLSSNHKNADIKYFLSIFPELQKIAAFA